MSDNKWFRKERWTPEDEEAFFARLKRCRSPYQKAQYVRIQAYHLQHASPPKYRAALELLDYFFRECPDPNEVSMAFLQKSKCLEALGADESALEALRESVKADLESGPRTTAILDFAMLVASRARKDLYPDVLDSLSKLPQALLVFPFSQYQFLSAMAVIGYESGKSDKARSYASQALDAWEKHQSADVYPKGATFPENPYPQVHARLLKLAKYKKPFWKFW